MQLQSRLDFGNKTGRKPSPSLNSSGPSHPLEFSETEVLARRTASSVLGPPNLLDLTKRSILKHIDSNFPLSNRPINVGSLFEALAIKIDSKIIILGDTPFAQMDIEQRAVIERLAPGSLPLPLWKALLNSYYCGTCHRLSSSPSRQALFRLPLLQQGVPGSDNSASHTFILAQICGLCNPKAGYRVS